MKKVHNCLACEQPFICPDELCDDSNNPSDSICDPCLKTSLLKFVSPDSRRFALPRSWVKALSR